MRGKTSDNIDKLSDLKVPGINENTVIAHVGIGYRYIPQDKLTASDHKAMAAVHAQNLKTMAK
tara:strand:- start:585 stop:773 length:189 start_codon:yes stop_codon:yes gene_type:complete